MHNKVIEMLEKERENLTERLRAIDNLLETMDPEQETKRPMRLPEPANIMIPRAIEELGEAGAKDIIKHIQETKGYFLALKSVYTELAKMANSGVLKRVRKGVYRLPRL